MADNINVSEHNTLPVLYNINVSTVILPQHDWHARPTEFAIGDRVFVLMLAARLGPAYKLARPFHGPFRVIATDANVVEVRRVDRPRATILHVSKCRVRRCPPAVPDTFWPGRASPASPKVNTPDSPVEGNVFVPVSIAVRGRLQIRMWMCDSLCLDRTN